MAHENYTLILHINPFQGRPSLGWKNLTRVDLNCKCHAPRTDGFISLPKNAVQDAPTYLLEKLNGCHTVQVVPTQWVETMSKCTKLTHNDHDKLLQSQLSTLITSLLEHRCYKLSGE